MDIVDRVQAQILLAETAELAAEASKRCARTRQLVEKTDWLIVASRSAIATAKRMLERRDGPLTQ